MDQPQTEEIAASGSRMRPTPEAPPMGDRRRLRSPRQDQGSHCRRSRARALSDVRSGRELKVGFSLSSTR